MMPLGLLANGECGTVTDIVGGKTIAERLTGMGLARGANVSVVKNDGAGPVIIALGDCRLALGRGMCHRVLINQAS